MYHICCSYLKHTILQIKENPDIEYITRGPPIVYITKPTRPDVVYITKPTRPDVEYITRPPPTKPGVEYVTRPGPVINMPANPMPVMKGPA